MKIKDSAVCCFSPTRRTFNITMHVVGGLALDVPSASLNMTSPHAREKEHVFSQDTLTIVGAPVYGGRLPRVAPPLFENITGQGAPAIGLVVYGGRDYGDALLELRLLLERRGFAVLAMGAFIARHAGLPSFSAGRPDKDDVKAAEEFGAAARLKLEAYNGKPSPLDVPGSLPHMPLPDMPEISPITNDKCIYCMQCYRWCPTGAIAYYSPNETDASACILCQGCVRRCPVDAREIVDEGYIQKLGKMAKMLENAPRREPEMFV